MGLIQWDPKGPFSPVKIVNMAHCKLKMPARIKTYYINLINKGMISLTVSPLNSPILFLNLEKNQRMLY